MEQMTNEEYVECGGTLCPYCRSEHIEGANIDFEGSVAYQNCNCHNCDAEWTDELRLTGYTEAVA